MFWGFSTLNHAESYGNYVKRFFLTPKRASFLDHYIFLVYFIWQCPDKGRMRVIWGKRNQKHAPICSKQNINENMGFHTWVYLAGIGRFRARTETEYQFFSPT